MSKLVCDKAGLYLIMFVSEQVCAEQFISRFVYNLRSKLKKIAKPVSSIRPVSKKTDWTPCKLKNVKTQC